jgi:predicted MFS family arabinose efflux permease
MVTQQRIVSERTIIALIASIQFVNVLDFMMVMPLGPDFASALAIPTSKLGLIGGSYTAAASMSGIVSSLFLDRFDRRKALFWAMLGLALGTLAGGLAWNMASLMAARVLAGMFGGPATSLALSIVTDTVPVARRGRAMGTVMGAFSLASIFGVPAGLELSRLGGWRLPFFGVGGLALVITVCAIALLPSMTAHLKERVAHLTAVKLPIFRTEVVMAYTAIAFAMLGGFMMIPNFSTFFQHNLGFPREKLGSLYFIGGGISFVAMRVAGRLVDRFGSFWVSLGAACLLLTSLIAGCVLNPPQIPILAIFTLFMLGMSIRGVAVSSLSSRIPRPQERARYLSFQSAVQHFASAAGAMLGAKLLTEAPGGMLKGMPRVAILSALISLFVLPLMFKLEARVRRLSR